MVAGALTWLTAAAHAGPAPWWDAEWEHRNRLTLAGASEFGESVQDFPLMVRLADGVNFDHGRAEGDGRDLRFVDERGVLLPYEIEQWDVDGESVVWVAIDVDAFTPLQLWLYYGNSSADAQAWASEAAWPDFDAVFHLGEEVWDSTARAITENDGGVYVVPGVVAYGSGFDKDGAYVVYQPTYRGGISVSGWVRLPIGWGTLGEQGTTLISGDDAQGTDFGWSVTRCLFGTALAITAGESTFCGVTPIDDFDWHYFLATTDGNQSLLWVDGNLDGVYDNVAGFLPGPSLGIGLDLNTGAGFIGELDEIRLARVARDEAWMYADIASQLDLVVTWCSAWGGDEDDDGACDDEDACPGADDFDGCPTVTGPNGTGSTVLPTDDGGPDVDGDGFSGAVDCDDADATVYPGAVEDVGPVDRDCDGRSDPTTPFAPSCGCAVPASGAGVSWLLAAGVAGITRARRRATRRALVM
jgi:biopolymer transport protein ExbB